MSSFKPAVRQGVGLLIGIAGPSGSGKTMSALRVARGLAAGDDSKIAFIDTEAGRALHYAAAEGEAPTATTFAFQHAPLTPPFTPERYCALIEEADRAGFKVIVIDSFSHEWDGEGGLMELHDEIHERMGGQDKQSIAAWKEPKLRHKRLVSRLLQCHAHLVICMRAEDKLRMEQVTETGSNGREYKKTVITAPKDLPPAERWAPICERRFPYELITSIVLTPDNPGVAVPLKLQAQHRAAVLNNGKPLDENVGEVLAAWARGATPAGPRPATEHKSPSSPTRSALVGGAPPGASPSFPGDLVTFAGASYDPARPITLAPCALDDMSDRELQDYGKALRKLIERAPDDQRQEWLNVNADDLLRVKARSHKLHGFIVEPVSTGVAAPAGEGAPGFSGGATGAPSTDQAVAG